MTEDKLIKVVMVWSCEEEDPKGQFLSMHERQQASRLASAEVIKESSQIPRFLEEELVLSRAQHLTTVLESQCSILQTARRLTQIRFPIFVIVTFAILGGLLSDPIGLKGHINLLHFPLLVLLIWNMTLFMWIGVKPVFQNPLTNGQPGWVLAGFSKVGLWVSQFQLRLIQCRSHEEKQWIVNSLVRFFGRWRSLAGQAIRLQLQSVLHVGAASLAIGAIIGLYLRGFALEYRVNWASTFLEAEHVHSIMFMILSPAAIILGIDFPSVQTIAMLRAPASENAAMWIHLWAVTCLLFIIIPRIGLAWAVRQKASAQLEDFVLPLDEPYFLRILAQYRGDGISGEVLPYQCQLDPSIIERLEGLCLEMFGNSVYVSTRPPIPYGETNYHVQVSSHMSLRVLVVFDVATTPEQEVHGEFLQCIQAQIEGWTSEASLLVFIYEESYRTSMDQQRQRERYQTWKRFTNGYGLEPIPFSVTSDVNGLLPQAAATLWTTRSQEVP